MIPNLKLLGLAITAVLAMSAFWAMAAQAAVPSLECTSSVGNTCTVTATELNTHTLNIQGGTLRCRSTLHATLETRKVTSVTGVTTNYTGCRFILGLGATVNMGTCTYTLTSAEDARAHTANMSIVCAERGRITIDAPSLPCTITIGPQGPLGHVIFTNEGAEPTHVRANLTVTGINYNMTGAGCPSSGNFSDGTYNGESTLEGFNDNAPNQAEGSKVGLHVVT